MREQEIPIPKKSLSELYIMKKDLTKRIEKDGGDWMAKHLLLGVNDEIRTMREQNLIIEQNNL